MATGYAVDRQINVGKILFFLFYLSEAPKANSFRPKILCIANCKRERYYFSAANSDLKYTLPGSNIGQIDSEAGNCFSSLNVSTFEDGYIPIPALILLKRNALTEKQPWRLESALRNGTGTGGGGGGSHLLNVVPLSHLLENI